MQTAPDGELLDLFARTGSDAAFGELVRRHISLVHSVARRRTEHPHEAEEITQAVFILLARKAASLGHQTVLSGWLYHTARLTAGNFRRAEFRRVHREQEVYMQSLPDETQPDLAWPEVAPLLDEAMGRLGTTDRDALVLRYFENKNLSEVGAALNLKERAAQKRVQRALEKLRAFLLKRGVASTTALIAGAISTNSIQAAPASLTQTVTMIAAAKGAAASGSTLTLVKGALKLMAWTKIKTGIVIGTVTLLLSGTAIIAVDEIKPHPPDSLVFTAEGLVTSEFQQRPYDTNHFGVAGNVLFLYSNNVWQIQFSRQSIHLPSIPQVPPPTQDEMIDDKRIPGGSREIATTPSARGAPAAWAKTNTFPDSGEWGVFLPWLALCPHPELPMVGTNRIHLSFRPELFDTLRDACAFKAGYLEPQQQFLSELIITNPGVFFLYNGLTKDYSAPYNQGFAAFSYKVLETTNCGGIIFPLIAELHRFSPLPKGRSTEDTYPNVSAKLTIRQIDIGGRHLLLAPVPTNMVVLDLRPEFENGEMMNYSATNDQYDALTNKWLERLIKSYRQRNGKGKVP